MAVRRSKKAKTPKPNGGKSAELAESKKTSPTSATATTTTSRKKDDEEITLKEQLDRALVAVQANQEQMAKIHFAWRSQLKLISMLVMMIVLSQLHAPTSSCLKEIKLSNEWAEINKNDEAVIGFLQAMKVSALDSMMELLSVLCGLSLIWLLSLPQGDDDFSTLPFRVSCAFIPFIASTYYRNRSLSCLDGLVDPISQSSSGGGDFSAEGASAPAQARRTFPVILIFHLISALSLWFMQAQRKQLESSIEKIQKLRKDLLEPKKKK